MPIEVYARLQSGTTAFSSASGTIVSLEFTGFIENVTAYSPSQILEAVSALYDLFDGVAASHPGVRRLCHSGHEILGYCGLFDFVDQPNDQIHHAALTCLEFAAHRDEINEKLAIELDIKCGIAFGGPLIGDLLHNKSPKFELTGPIVNEAINIRKDTPQGSVYVSATVQKLLKPDVFNCQAVEIPGRKVSGIFEIELKIPHRVSRARSSSEELAE
jgi:class 3 adenylate cyclase